MLIRTWSGSRVRLTPRNLVRASIGWFRFLWSQLTQPRGDAK